MELTVPWNNMVAAVQRKTDKYQDLITEIMSNGYKCDNTPLEVGTRGLINQRNKAVITNMCHDMKIKKAHMGPTAKNANIVQKSLYILSLGRASEIIVNCVEEKINKHCQRHNGPESSVHLSKVTYWVISQVQTQILVKLHLQNFEQVFTSKFQPNITISTKLKTQNIDQT